MLLAAIAKYVTQLRSYVTSGVIKGKSKVSETILYSFYLQAHFLVRSWTSRRVTNSFKMSRSCVVLMFFVFCIGIYVRAITVPFVDCGSTAVTVTNLDLDCEAGVPELCKFIKGNTYHGKISFTTKEEITSGKIVLHGTIGSVKLPFPLDHPDICSGHNLTCPMAAEQNEVLTMDLEVPSYAPTTRLVVEVEIKPSSESSTSYMCMEFLGEIKDGNNL